MNFFSELVEARMMAMQNETVACAARARTRAARAQKH